MRGKRFTKVAVTAAALLAAGVAAGTVSASADKAQAQAGGTFRVGVESSFGFTNSFDPTGEYLGNMWAIYSSLMLRTLVGYNHVAGPAGNVLRADLATEVPKASADGKTYTFTIKNGVKFGPPVNREITSADVVTAMERLANPKEGGQYAYYYAVIKGWKEFAEGKAKTISGISAPSDKTISFTLTAPTGDFLYRMAQPATAPMPKEVVSCFAGKPGTYGRNIVSSGPYMFEGSDKVVISSCKAIKPVSGFDGQTKMNLVRNPAYDASTDSKAAREALPDRFEFIVNTNADDIYEKTKRGDLETQIASPTPKVIREYVTDPKLKSRLKLNSSDSTNYITMNLTQPPFDDLHVRRAMNFVMDKTALIQSLGGSTIGQLAGHIAPDAMLNNLLKGYDPYKSPGGRGDLEKAKAEMRKSKYDTDKDGICDADACNNILMITEANAASRALSPIVQTSAGKIGILFQINVINGAYPVIQNPSKNVPISVRPRWGKDYPDAYTFFGPLFDGRNIIPAGNTNYSLVGITPAKAKQVKASGTVTGVPSVDKDIDRCTVLVGAPRVKCFADLDRKLMETVVPWIPYVWRYQQHILGPTVTKWSFDQFSGDHGYAHVAVK